MANADPRVARFRNYLDTSTKKGAVTKTRYMYEVRRFLDRHCGRLLSDLERGDILAWNASLHDADEAPGTKGLKLAAVRCFLDYLEYWAEDERAGKLLGAMNRLQQPIARAVPTTEVSESQAA